GSEAGSHAGSRAGSGAGSRAGSAHMQVFMLGRGLLEPILKLVHMQGLMLDHMPMVMESRIIHI
ncbi:hypothetical protein A2U01_0102864, partial [Trifolium medium]|nr:hypothetical protein [Trifolium medium]